MALCKEKVLPSCGISCYQNGLKTLKSSFLKTFFFRTMGNQHVSSRPISIDVQVAQDQAGLVIGRGGQTIKEIEKRSNTRIHFKDELSTKEFRFICIKGNNFTKSHTFEKLSILTRKIVENFDRPILFI